MKSLIIIASIFVSSLAVPLIQNNPKDIPNHPDCPLVPGPYPTYVENPYECHSYYECDIGRTARYFECSSGLYWNHLKKTCDWPENVNCDKVTTTPGTTEWTSTPSVWTTVPTYSETSESVTTEPEIRINAY